MKREQWYYMKLSSRNADHFRIQNNTVNFKYTIDGQKTASAIFSMNALIQGNHKKVRCLLVGRLLDNDRVFVLALTTRPEKGCRVCYQRQDI
jgi:hypothetical protein